MVVGHRGLRNHSSSSLANSGLNQPRLPSVFLQLSLVGENCISGGGITGFSNSTSLDKHEFPGLMRLTIQLPSNNRPNLGNSLPATHASIIGKINIRTILIIKPPTLVSKGG